MKIFTDNDNYLPPLIKQLTVSNNCLPLTEIFIVNNSYLTLIKPLTVRQ